MRVVPEAMWTRPREDCSHPERWSSTDPQSTELEVSELVATFVRALQPDYVVETGTCIGITARMIGEALAANGQGRLVTLEVDPERAAAAAAYCAGLPVEVRCQPSLEFTPEEPVGFAWFDSLLSLRVAEFERFRPWLATGTIVGFHDTGPHFGQYGDDVAQIPGTRSIRLRTPRGVTFAEVL
jgi:hypothetical protein